LRNSGVMLGAMYPHLSSLLRQAFNLAVTYMGTTGLAVAAGLLLFIVRVYLAWRRGGPDAMRKQFLGDAGHGLILTVLLWGALFSWCVIKAVYDDHQSLVKTSNNLIKLNGELRASNEQLKSAAQNKNVSVKPEGNANERARRKIVREKLGAFLTDGEKLKLRCTHSDMGLAPTKEEAISWAKSVNDYLLKELDKSYSARFLTNRDRMLPVAPVGLKPETEGIWFGINSQTSALSDFIVELK